LIFVEEGRIEMRTLTPWRRRIGAPLLALEHEMEDLFHKFFGEAAEGAGAMLQTWSPRVDIEETENELIVKADLPGVDAKDVDISVAGSQLVIRGQRREERDTKDRTFHRMERFVGEFFREIPLPPGLDPDHITATASKGVLTITIPKKEEVRPKRIPVTSEDEPFAHTL
jgi:HSP20 family protein